MLPFFLNSNALLFLQLEFCAMWLIITFVVFLFPVHLRGWAYAIMKQYMWTIFAHNGAYGGMYYTHFKEFCPCLLPRVKGESECVIICMHDVRNTNLCDKGVAGTIGVGQSSRSYLIVLDDVIPWHCCFILSNTKYTCGSPG